MVSSVIGAAEAINKRVLYERERRALLIQTQSGLHLVKSKLLGEGVEVGRSEGLLVLAGDAGVVADVLEPADQVLLQVLRHQQQTQATEA